MVHETLNGSSTFCDCANIILHSVTVFSFKYWCLTKPELRTQTVLEQSEIKNNVLWGTSLFIHSSTGVVRQWNWGDFDEDMQLSCRKARNALVIWWRNICSVIWKIEERWENNLTRQVVCIWCNTVACLCNHRCGRNVTVDSLCVVALHVTISYIKVLSVAQWSFCGNIMSLATLITIHSHSVLLFKIQICLSYNCDMSLKISPRNMHYSWG